MARTLGTREKILAGILVVTAILVLYYGTDGESIGPGSPGGPSKKEKDKPLGEPPVIHLALLERETDGLGADARNLFDYYVPPPPPRLEPPAPPPRRIEQPVPINPNPVPRAPAGPAAPVPPTPDFDYLGYIGPIEAKIAVFGKGEDVLLAQVGEVVDERYRLLEFGYETVVLGYTEERFGDKTTEVKLRQTKDTPRKSKRK
jgi:hypothetical protein